MSGELAPENMACFCHGLPLLQCPVLNPPLPPPIIETDEDGKVESVTAVVDQKKIHAYAEQLRKREAGRAPAPTLNPSGTQETAMAKTKALAINCTGIEMVPIQDLKPFQGGFKELRPAERAKLKKEIKELGLVEPITVWKEGKKNHVMNGHQRLDLLREMVKSEEITVDMGLPVQYVQAEDSATAARIVLALASTYGRINKKGMGRFLKKAGLTDDFVQERFSFPDFDIDNMDNAEGKDDKKVEFTASQKPKNVKCPQCATVFDSKKHRFKAGDDVDGQIEDNGD